MHNINPNTLLFFEKLKNIVSECQNQGQFTLRRYVADEKNEYGKFDLYSNDDQREFNRNFNYYNSTLETNSLIRYHAISKSSKDNDLAQEFIEDLITSFINPEIGFQLVLQYTAHLTFNWMDTFFGLDMPEEDRVKIFRILGPSSRFHEMILGYHDKPELYPLFIDCLVNYGSDNAEPFYNDVIECFLDNGYIEESLWDEYLEMAVQYTTRYVRAFKSSLEYDQSRIFNTVRQMTMPEDWLKFKDAFPLITINAPVQVETNFFAEVPSYIKKIGVDSSAISKSYNMFMQESDVHTALYRIEEYINKNKLLEINRMYRQKSFIYLEAETPINTELFVNIIQGLFRELAQLDFEDFNKIIKDNKDDLNFIEKHISKLVLDFTLPIREQGKTKINKI